MARSGPWKVYAVRGVSLVQGLSRRPVVVPVGGDTGNALAWLDVATPWFEDQTGARPAADGPSSWPRVGSPSLHADGPRLAPVTVSHVVVGPNTVSFHVDRTGIPVEVRMSYFPWWQATGVQGPWKLDPDNLVVIPTSHDVVLAGGSSACRSPRPVDLSAGRPRDDWARCVGHAHPPRGCGPSRRRLTPHFAHLVGRQGVISSIRPTFDRRHERTAQGAIDGIADDVGMPGVPSGLLDQMEQDPTDSSTAHPQDDRDHGVTIASISGRPCIPWL